MIMLVELSENPKIKIGTREIIETLWLFLHVKVKGILCAVNFCWKNYVPQKKKKKSNTWLRFCTFQGLALSFYNNLIWLQKR